MLRKAAELLKQHLGPDAPPVGNAAHLLGAALFEAGLYREAIAESEAALAIRRKTADPATVQTLYLLGNALLGQKDLVRAEQVLLESLGLQEKLGAANDIRVAEMLNSLGGLYDARGDFSSGEKSYNRALAILRARNLSQDDRLLVAVVGNLGLLYQGRGDLEDARPHLEQALQLREKLLANQPDHPQIARAAMNLATNYQESGKLESAESLYGRALGIFTKRGELETLDVARISVNLAMIHLLREEYDRAEPLYNRSVSVREKLLGASHPDTGGALERLAVFYQVTGRRSDALTAMRRAVEITEQNLALTIASGSEQQKISYMDTLQENTDILLSMREQFRSDPAFNELSVVTIIQRKGRVLDALVDVTARMRGSVSPAHRATFDDLSKARTDLANLVLSGRQPLADEHAAQVEKLQGAVDRLERQLSNSTPQLRGEVRPVTIGDVLAILPADAALVEFVKYRPFDPKAIGRFNRFGAPRYAAFVLRSGRHSWVELGAAEDIEPIARAWHRALKSPTDRTVREKGRGVYQRLFSPLRKDVGDAQRLFLVPDDALNLLPFSALTADDNRYLIESRAITYLASSRDVLRFGKGPPPREPALIAAAPEFVAAGTPTVSSNPSFEPLPGAAREGRAIAQIVPGARFVDGRAASESRVKQVHGPTLVHLATHAFFVGQSQRPAAPSATDPSRGLTQVGRMSMDPAPLLRAGIAFAGAGATGEGGEDGILTALEAASLDLHGTKLVVLSACETGVGDVRAGDGVHGFRRALTLAGAESQVLTLWRVDDAISADLMVEFYRRLKKGIGRGAALRLAQLAVLRNSAKSHPFFWAAFIGAGDISPMSLQ